MKWRRASQDPRACQCPFGAPATSPPIPPLALQSVTCGSPLRFHHLTSSSSPGHSRLHTAISTLKRLLFTNTSGVTQTPAHHHGARFGHSQTCGIQPACISNVPILHSHLPPPGYKLTSMINLLQSLPHFSISSRLCNLEYRPSPSFPWYRCLLSSI